MTNSKEILSHFQQSQFFAFRFLAILSDQCTKKHQNNPQRQPTTSPDVIWLLSEKNTDSILVWDQSNKVASNKISSHPSMDLLLSIYIEIYIYMNPQQKAYAWLAERRTPHWHYQKIPTLTISISTFHTLECTSCQVPTGHL